VTSFSITCTTCHQRLRVRDESAIGELLICPKCGSMVLVETPAESRSSALAEPAVPDSVAGAKRSAARSPSVEPVELPAEPIELPAAEQEPDAVADEEEIEPPPEIEPPVIAPPITSDYAGTPLGEWGQPQWPDTDELTEPPLPDADYADQAEYELRPEQPPLEEEPEAPPLTPDSAALVAAVAESPLAPPPAVAPPSAAPVRTWLAAERWQQGLKLAGAAVGGIALALGLFAVLASRTGQPSLRGSPKPASEADPGLSSVPDQPPQSTADQPEAKPPDAKPPAAEPLSPPETSPVKKELAVEPGTKPAVEPLGVAAPATAKPAGDKVPSPMPLEPAAKPDAGADATALEATLKALSPLTDGRPAQAAKADAPAPAVEPDATAKPDGKSPPADEPAPDEPAAPRPAPREVDVQARLQDAILEVEYALKPLADICQDLTSFSTIPITLDPDALALVKVTPRTPVTVKLKDTTVAAVLDAALRPLKLGYTVVGQQIVVSRPPLPDGQLRQLSHPVGDLVGNDNQNLQQLAAIIVDAIQPQSWQINGGQGTIKTEMPNLVIQQQETILFQVIQFCEKLRTARGLPAQSKFDPALFRLEPRWSRAQPKLATRVTLNFAEPTPLVRIFKRLTDDTGVSILVDWVAVAELGWNPDGAATLSANQEPLGELLTRLLQPLDLAYRAIDETTVQVTAPPLAQLRNEVELYPVGDLLSPAVTAPQLLQRIREQFLTRDLAGVVPVFCVDPPSKHLIAALPQPQQQAFAQWLAAQRGPKEPAAKP
jgi:hypothetical protein